MGKKRIEVGNYHNIKYNIFLNSNLTCFIIIIIIIFLK